MYLQRSRDLASSVRRGRVLQKTATLHNVEALNTDRYITCDYQVFGAAAASFFAEEGCVSVHGISGAISNWLVRDRERLSSRGLLLTERT